jgi:hypothetical protein
MNYHVRSFKTKSYWIYALWSVDSLKTFLAVVGAIWMGVDILDNFHLLNKSTLPLWLLAPLILIGVVVVIITRRPVKRIRYKHPGIDLTVEVLIGDLFEVPGQKVISTNTTFDTDIASGIISNKSLQGIFTNMYYPGDVPKLDAELAHGLQGIPSTQIQKAGKTDRYDFGTTVKLKIGPEYFYWLAMAQMNINNTAKTELKDLNNILEGLWEFIETKGEKLDTVIPVIGSGLGRLVTNRKKLIAIIAQSFVTASQNQVFVNKLTIVVHPSDIEKSNLNLFEVKDLLQHYLP